MNERATKRTGMELKRDILKLLSNKKPYSISFLERKIKSDWDTIKKHCDELEVFEALIYDDNKVKITEKGFEYLKRINEKINKS